MATFITTVLGRDVPASEWGTVLQDLVLKVLHDFRLSPFNPENVPMSRTALCNAAGLPPAEVDAVVESLIPMGQVEKLPGPEPRYRITGPGVIFVRNVPQGISGFLR